MSNKRYPEEFRIEAVKLERDGRPPTERSELQGQAAEVRRLKAELKRASETLSLHCNSLSTA